jgi:putative pyruvate formate lyase activating enzyme
VADFIVEQFEAAYRTVQGGGDPAARIAAGLDSLRPCRACPRHCKVDRLADETKICKTGRCARVNSAFAHFGEEDCLRGHAGSGTIFFAGCNLRCVFCQNWDISQRAVGQECTPEQIAETMLALQAQGCHNINFVTPEHVVPQVVEAVFIAIQRGLTVPIVYNTGAYDSLEALKLVDGLVDIYMPDFKLWSPKYCARYLGAKDYAERAREAIAEMHRQVGDLRLTPDGIACRGLLVRHLVMPGLLDESRRIFDWLAESISRDTFINIMAQYRPAHLVGNRMIGRDGRAKTRFAEINRSLSHRELAEAYRLAREAGLWRFDSRAFN